MAVEYIPPIGQFPADGQIWKIDWFGEVSKIPDRPTDYQMQVLLNKHSDPNPDKTKVYLNVGDLPAITLGSLWKDQRLVKRTVHKVASFPGLLINLNYNDLGDSPSIDATVEAISVETPEDRAMHLQTKY